MKKIKLSLLFLSLLGICLTGCNSNNIVDDPNNDNAQDNEKNNGENDCENINVSNKAMVVYFSATGNTRRVANMISSYIDSPIYELEPVDPYTQEDLNYNDSNSRVSKERNDPNHLTELVNANFDEFDESKYIFIGAPIWWGQLSWVINDFVLSNNFLDKTIIPFATASSSSFNIGGLKHLSEEATWLEGRRFRISEINEETINSWIDSLNINF